MYVIVLSFFSYFFCFYIYQRNDNPVAKERNEYHERFQRVIFAACYNYENLALADVISGNSGFLKSAKIHRFPGERTANTLT